jgi:protein SHQ1
MCGDFGPESARTINETSTMLSCSAALGELSIKEVLVECCRRCMTYSLYKSLKVCEHVQHILAKYLSRSYVRVILEDLHKLLERSEPRYLLNRIFIEDYLLYVYSLNGETGFAELVAEIEKSGIKEGDLNLGIE